MTLPDWKDRPSEEANLFNPAYCGAIVREFVRAFSKEVGNGTPLSLVFCAMPIVMHPETRRRLPKTVATSLYPWIEDHPEALVGYTERTRNLVPFVREAIRFGVSRRALVFDEEGALLVGASRASVTKRFLEDATPDVRETAHAASKVGRWFARAGQTPTILAAWGIRP